MGYFGLNVFAANADRMISRMEKCRGCAVYTNQLDAYRIAQNTNENMSGRDIEAAALTRCALLLSDCRKNWDAPGRDAELSEALRINQIVWSILQSELVKDDNPLPVEIRKDILTLSVFIDNRIIEVMAQPAPEKLKIIIDINLNLAAGLHGSPAD
jgi:flagellar biosynthesis activator protein FlaF